MPSQTFINQRKNDCYDKIDLILEELPEYCKNYFINYLDSEKEKSPLTTLAYARNTLLFFRYLVSANPILHNTKDVSIDILDQMTQQDLQEYMNYLKRHRINQQKKGMDEDEKKGIDAKARSQHLAAIRSLFGYLKNGNYIKTDVSKLVSNPKIVTHKKGALEKSELATLISSVENGVASDKKQKIYTKNTIKRDTAIILILAGTGIRVSELVGLDLDDINWKEKSITITRKGQKVQTLFFGEEIEDALNDYIDFERQPYNDAETALFVASRGACGRLTPRSVERMVKKFGENVLSINNLTCHMLRRTYGRNLYALTNDIYLVSESLGHSDVKTTVKHYTDIEKSRMRSITQYSKELAGK